MYNIYICYLKGTDGVRGELCVNKELDGWHKVGVGGTRWEQRNHGSSGVLGWDSGAKKHYWHLKTANLMDLGCKRLDFGRPNLRPLFVTNYPQKRWIIHLFQMNIISGRVSGKF